MGLPDSGLGFCFFFPLRLRSSSLLFVSVEVPGRQEGITEYTPNRLAHPRQDGVGSFVCQNWCRAFGFCKEL